MDSTSNIFTVSGATNAEVNYSSYCIYRLPCGICTRTNSICPLSGGTITPSWAPAWQQPPVIYTTQTGTGFDPNKIIKGETTAHMCNQNYD